VYNPVRQCLNLSGVAPIAIAQFTNYRCYQSTWWTKITKPDSTFCLVPFLNPWVDGTGRIAKIRTNSALCPSFSKQNTKSVLTGELALLPLAFMLLGFILPVLTGELALLLLVFYLPVLTGELAFVLAFIFPVLNELDLFLFCNSTVTGVKTRTPSDSQSILSGNMVRGAKVCSPSDLRLKCGLMEQEEGLRLASLLPMCPRFYQIPNNFIASYRSSDCCNSASLVSTQHHIACSNNTDSVSSCSTHCSLYQCVWRVVSICTIIARSVICSLWVFSSSINFIFEF